MLAVRDENIVNAAQAARQAQGKSHVAPKTPGARFPKTPAKIPLNDENALGGKTGLGKAKGTLIQSAKQRNVMTPSEPQSRAPLGNKTTNAKARNGQSGGVKGMVNDLEKTQAKPTTIKKQRQKAPAVEPLKVSIHNDNKTQDEPDVEFAPPRPKDLPYQSDVFPDGTLTFEGLKKENMFKGYYDHFYNPIGDDGRRLLDRQHDRRMQKALKQHEEDILRDIEETDWSIPGVPGSENIVKKKAVPASQPSAIPQDTIRARDTTKHPPTINSRRAASALSRTSGTADSTIRASKAPIQAPARRPLSSILPGNRGSKIAPPSRTATADSAVGDKASRNTLGYTKGRSASSIINGRPQATAPVSGRDALKPKTPKTTKPKTTTSSASAATMKRAPTPVQQQEVEDEAQRQEAMQRLQFLSIFEPGSDDDADLGGEPQFDDDLDDDFELKLA